ncbi:hypothetical protein [Noviherbaspirillum aerium]|uniref:hypothetical protein n=1 Tax=Noviherbaspirillum aerium TaxID=2588497 RepID=UPI001CEF6FA0|nr:hypothetical protein [Noviherbaspirillum aerium]
MLEVLLVLALMAATVFWFQKRSAKKALESLEQSKRDQKQAADTELAAVRDGYETRIKSLNDKIDHLRQENQSLAPYTSVRDTAAECERLRQESRDLQRNATFSAAQIVASANEEATKIRAAAKTETEDLKKLMTLDAKNKRDRAEQELAEANRRATQVINDAKKRAEEIAGDALRALQDAEALQATAAAMKNVIEGYGDRYLKPSKPPKRNRRCKKRLKGSRLRLLKRTMNNGQLSKLNSSNFNRNWPRPRQETSVHCPWLSRRKLATSTSSQTLDLSARRLLKLA